MLKQYNQIANTAIACAVCCGGAIVYFGQGSQTGNVWGPGGAPIGLAWVAVGAIVLAFWAYAKAKGRSGWLGVLLPLLNIVGLIILLRLQDLSDRAPDIKCPKCGGVNAGEDETCRYCHTSLSLQNEAN